MKKSFKSLLLLSMLVPQLVFASWWNPFSWGIFSIFKAAPKEHLVEPGTSKLEQMSVVDPGNSIGTSTSNEKIGTSSPSIPIIPKSAVAPTSPVQNTETVSPKPKNTRMVEGCTSKTGYSATNGISCTGDGSCSSDTTFDKSTNSCVTPLEYCQNHNGKYSTYNSENNTCGCADGYSFNGSNTCVANKNGYQVCGEMNATWDGTSYTSTGGFNCICKTGFSSGADGKSCVVATKPSGTLCNGTYWNSCPVGQDMVCPSNGGGAYCQPQYQAPIAQPQSPTQDPSILAQDQALLSEYNSKIAAIDQQILDIRTQEQVDLSNNSHSAIPLEFMVNRSQVIQATADNKVYQLNLQKEQLRLYYLNLENQLLHK